MQIGGEGDQEGQAGGFDCGDPAAVGEEGCGFTFRELAGDVFGFHGRGAVLFPGEGQEKRARGFAKGGSP